MGVFNGDLGNTLGDKREPNERGLILLSFANAFNLSPVKDVRGWQFLTMKAVKIVCIVCLPPENHIS